MSKRNDKYKRVASLLVDQLQDLGRDRFSGTLFISVNMLDGGVTQAYLKHDFKKDLLEEPHEETSGPPTNYAAGRIFKGT